jgi:hypothetical protein
MDVHCSTCAEPWDISHLLHEAIFDTGVTPEEARAWSSLRRCRKLSHYYREQFRAVGWEFGLTVINVIRCPCCPKETKPNRERAEIKAALEELLGDDPDGLASTLEDFDL